jgi:hypothetical protein
MSNKFGNETELVAAIRELPGSLAPRRDLWPDISARLPDRAGGAVAGEGGQGWRRQALAASLAIAFAAGILLGRQIATEPPGEPMNAPANLALLATLQASEREYQAAFRQFIPVGAAQGMLESQAIEHIENSWLELQQAETALLAALEQHPENTYLNQRLLDLRAQQLGFMKQIATLDQFSRRKT